MRMTSGVLWVWAAIAAAGCGEASHPSAAGQELRTAPEESAHVAIPESATPEQIVPLNAKRYASGFVAEGTIVKGALSQGGRSDHLLVLKTGHCYRVIGAADESVADMDLLLYDPNGVQVNQDSGTDRFPVLGMQSEVCPPAGGAYRVQVYMYQGSGAFAFGLYRSP